MAMSLEDLLAEEGFKRRKAKMKARASFASERTSVPLYMEQDRHESGSLLAVRRTERTRSDIPRYDSKAEFSTSSSFAGRKPRTGLSRRGKMDQEPDKGNAVNNERRGNRNSLDVKRFSIGSSEDLQGSEITEVAKSDEIVEVGMNRSYKDINSNNIYSRNKNEQKHSARFEERERYRNKDIVIDNKKDKNDTFIHAHPHAEHRSSRDPNLRSVKQPQSSEGRSNKVPESGNKFGNSRSIRQNELDEAQAAPALDEAAIKAIISIFSGHAKRFLDDEDFRTSLHHNSFASLNLIGVDESLSTESKVIENLEQAIETVERAAEESATIKELKRASLQLSVITGLNSIDLKDGLTSGVPNLRLSACAHLYLSIIYVLQKKDKVAAKHLLQVFCDSPFQARTALLPDLWDRAFLPHLLHLKVWYDKETHTVADSPIFTNLKLLDKAYNESLDSGTYEFAVYYKDWMMDGVGAPSVPFIKIPSFSVQLILRGGLLGHTSSPASHASPQPMVSKELYDEVFKHADKPGVQSELYEEENFDNNAARSPNSPAPEDKQLILYTCDLVTQTNKVVEPVGANNISVAEEAWIMHSESGEENRHEDYGSSQRHQGKLHISYETQALPPAKENKLVVERPQNPVLKMKHNQDSVLHAAARFLPYPEDVSDHVVSETEREIMPEAELESPVREVQENDEYYMEESFQCSIPKDYLCPLTGFLFKNPVTLETGQTFENEAITEWFSKGCFTCPVTRKTLQYQAVPPTNLILKRIIDKWKTDNIEDLLTLLSQVTSGSGGNVEVNDNVIICVLGQLLPVFSKEERIIHARRVISTGGLQFLLTGFHSANARDKTYILALLCCCIDADPGCMNCIARNINQSSLLELLHGEKLISRKNTVLLLTKLICFNRRSRAKCFLEGLGDEEILNALDQLNMYLQSCPLEQTPLVAILILHLDLLSERHTSKAYRQEAVDALTTALIRSLSDDEKLQKKCCRALLILGGFFSLSGKLMTEDWILKLAGFLNGPDWDIADNESATDGTATTCLKVDSVTDDDEEENARERWLTSLSSSLLGDGKKSFLDAVSKCLSSGKSELVRVCLTTVAWLSFSLASLHDTKYQLSAFSALISPLKQYLQYGVLVEQRILASLSLLNFSTIPECRILLMKIGDEISSSLDEMAEVTWTARELYTVIYGQRR